MNKVTMDDVISAKLELLEKHLKDDFVIQMNYITFKNLFSPSIYTSKIDIKESLKEGRKLFGMEVKINSLMDEDCFVINTRKDYEYNKKLEEKWIKENYEKINNLYKSKEEL
jgi:hypothetical protein